jgi:hypothetical protein
LRNLHIPTTKKSRTRLKLFLEVKEKLSNMNLQNQAKQKNTEGANWNKEKKQAA